MKSRVVFGGGLARSIRNGLVPKIVAMPLLFSIIASNAYAQSTTGISDFIDDLDEIEVWGSPYEPPYEGRYDSFGGWEWVQRDNDHNSGTFQQTIPVDPPPAELTCPEVAEKMAALDCPNHPYQRPNGCGQEGWLGVLIPETLPNTPIDARPACNAHDVCYGMLAAQKGDCDLQLGDDIRTQCTSQAGQMFIRDTCNVQIDEGTMPLNLHDCQINATQICIGSSYIYQGAVQAYGFDGFLAAQTAASCAALRDLKNTLDCP